MSYDYRLCYPAFVPTVQVVATPWADSTVVFSAKL